MLGDWHGENKKITTMNKYTIFCTESQTKKAFELGAPIEKKEIQVCDNAKHFFWYDGFYYNYPTAEQMINWLEGYGFNFETASFYTVLEHDKLGTMGFYEGTRNEATLIAIDTALDYLSNKSK